MVRARLLAGAAVLAAVCALPSSVQAQTGPCPVFVPQPCLIFDASKAIEQASDLKLKAEQLQSMIEKAKEMTSIQGALGAVKGAVSLPYGGVTPIAPIQPITADAAVAELNKRLPTVGKSEDSKNEFRKTLATERRASAGDGWAIAETTKVRLRELDLRARTIQAVAICSARKPSANADESLRKDWQINTRAKTLVMQTMATMKEVSAASMQAKSVNIFTMDEVAEAPSFERAAAPAPAVVKDSNWAPSLGEIANLANKLSALLTAKSLLSSFKDSIADTRTTQAEYGQILQAAQQSEQQVQNLAASDGRKKGVGAAALLKIANDYMTQDRTTWDDASKKDVANKLAGQAEDRMDKIVSGDVSNSWSDYLANRAEAYKQEAFFRPIAEDAKAMADDTERMMVDYSKQLGLEVTNQQALDAEIAKTQAQLGTIKDSMKDAPVEVIQQRDAIYNNTVQDAAASAGEMAAIDAENAKARTQPIE